MQIFIEAIDLKIWEAIEFDSFKYIKWNDDERRKKKISP